MVGTMSFFLFWSGFCSLIYQQVWLREFRLIFGGTTAATSAVIAIFMGGLGFGGLFFGSRADKHSHPLRLYARLEIGVSLFAALTPLLYEIVRGLYLATGGTTVLGERSATLLRLLLTTLIFGLPTFFMGGSLPAAIRTIETEYDLSRQRLAAIYGVNTLGALAGAALSTFYLLEGFGQSFTLFLACFLNFLVGACAWLMSSSAAPALRNKSGEELELLAGPTFGSEPAFALAAGVLGFTFFFMEMVWYRLLSPLIGGSTYTFGLILMMVLGGIGLGGIFYSLFHETRAPSSRGFALILGVEALCLAVPFAMGDHLAIAAALLQPFGAMGFFWKVLTWLSLLAVVVFPAALVSGFQFPYLIGLMGRARRDVGAHTGKIYAWNTLGAVLGSLAGGFGALPLLTACGAWRAAINLLAVFGAISTVRVWAGERNRPAFFASLGVCLLAIVLSLAEGPTGFWRHSGIGAERTGLQSYSRNEVLNWRRTTLRNLAAEWEGKESSVGMVRGNAISFFVDGKSDGNAYLDAATQVMIGMLPALLHPSPGRVFVLGLGTGSTAGWLGTVPGIQQVDVAELEPAIIDIASNCRLVNRNVLENPKVRVLFGDGREYLQTTSMKYDLIVSEPSNPYRAGIARLYTRNFYESVSRKLKPRGYFAQFLQGYEVDSTTLISIYRTLCAVFPNVETWQTNSLDLLFICSMEETEVTMTRLREKILTSPFREALKSAWNCYDIEGIAARYIGNADFARDIAQKAGGIPENTDDQMVIEFGFARTLGNRNLFSVSELRQMALERNQYFPKWDDGSMNAEAIIENQILLSIREGLMPNTKVNYSPDTRNRISAYSYFIRGNYGGVVDFWKRQARFPTYPTEKIVLGEALADRGDDLALPLAEKLMDSSPGEAWAIMARFFFRKGRIPETLAALEKCLQLYRSDPWILNIFMARTLEMIREISKKDPSLSLPIYVLLREPFAVYCLEEMRQAALMSVALDVGFAEGARIFGSMEPFTPWISEALQSRVECYEKTNDSRLGKAREELEEFNRGNSQPLDQLLSAH